MVDPDGESGTPGCVGDAQLTLHVVFDDHLGDVESQTGPFGAALGGVVGLEDPFDLFSIDTAAVVFDADGCDAVLLGDADRNFRIGYLALDEDVLGVGEEVEDHLGKLPFVAVDGDGGLGIADEGDVGIADRGIGEADRFVAGVGDVEVCFDLVGFEKVAKVVDGVGHELRQPIGIVDRLTDGFWIGLAKLGCRLELHQDRGDLAQRLAPLVGDHAQHHPDTGQTGLVEQGTLFLLGFGQCRPDPGFEVAVGLFEELLLAGDPLPVAGKHRGDLPGDHQREQPNENNHSQRDHHHKADVLLDPLFKLLLLLGDGLFDVVDVETGADHPAVTGVETEKSDLAGAFGGMGFFPIVIDKDPIRMFYRLIDKFPGDVGAHRIGEIRIEGIDTFWAEGVGTQVVVGVVNPDVTVTAVSDALDVMQERRALEVWMVAEVVDDRGDLAAEGLLLPGEVLLLDVTALLLEIALLRRDEKIDRRHRNQYNGENGGEEDPPGDIFFAEHRRLPCKFLE